MLFNSALISSLLFASAVLAKRHRGHHHSKLPDHIQKPVSAASDETEYSGNWAGAVWKKGDGTFDSITGTFTVPVPTGQSGSAASAWVGIDGYTCTSGLLQAGVNFVVGDNGAYSYEAWYEWYPDHSYFFSGISISAGDEIKVSVGAVSPTGGLAMIENLSNGQSALRQLQSSHALCGQNAEWIVEDFMQGNSQVPFANFGTVTFKDIEATGTTGTYALDGAITVDMEQNYQVLTSVSMDKSSVTIKHL